MLSPGEKAPLTIKIQDENEQHVSLEKYLGSYIVLYFYPKDDTPGCTVEACNFRDATTKLQELGATVIGVSKDSAASHQKFKQKHTLTFPLWSDPHHELLAAFGAWGQKKMFGKAYMGIIRSTFIIDPEGVIIKTWEKVDPKKHDQEVLDFLREHTHAVAHN